MGETSDYKGIKYLFFSNSISEQTFERENQLPPLPVPLLEKTLEKYVKSVKPFIDEKSFEKIKIQAINFENGIGRQLQDLLVKKGESSRNWVEKWWEDYAYLFDRTPLVPGHNMAGPHPYNVSGYWTPNPDKAFHYAATVLWILAEFHLLIRIEHLRPQFSTNGDRLSMHQFRQFFNMTRIPGSNKDQLVSYFRTVRDGGPCPRHMIALCNGRIWKFVPSGPKGNPLPLSQIESQLEYINHHSKQRGPGVAALTLDERSQWAENREYLMKLSENNKLVLELVESAICHLSMEDTEPKDLHELYWYSLCGYSVNRWCDKTHTSILFKNGLIGSNIEHTPCDAMVSVVIGHYGCEFFQQDSPQTDISSDLTEIPHPTELVFDVDETILKAIETAKETNFAIQRTVEAHYCAFNDFGRNWLKGMKLHPDTFVQCAIQLAYYKLHKRVAPTYETATARQFYHGRTETVRSCTPEMKDWVLTMESSSASVQEKKDKLRIAMETHLKLMNEAKSGHGCDRHLMGLYLLCLENDMPIPELFLDEAFIKSGGGGNFILSTSTVGPTNTLGGVAPMVKDGYAVMYSFNPNSIQFALSNFKEQGTSSDKFMKTLKQAMLTLKEILDAPISKM